MAGTTVSFIADPKLAARVKEIARSDGVTQSQAAARAAALGALLSPAARRTLRFVLDQGGEDAQRQLAVAVAKAIAQVSNAVIERQLLARSGAAGGNEEGDAREAVDAVAAYRRTHAETPLAPGSNERLVPSSGFGD